MYRSEKQRLCNSPLLLGNKCFLSLQKILYLLGQNYSYYVRILVGKVMIKFLTNQKLQEWGLAILIYNSKLVVGKKVTLARIPTKLLRHLSGFQGIFEVTLAADIVSDSCRKAVVAKTPGQGQSSQVFTSFRFEILNYPNRCANYTSRKADGGQRKNGLCRREMNIGYEHRTNHVNTCPSNFLFCIIIITIIFIIII